MRRRPENAKRRKEERAARQIRNRAKRRAWMRGWRRVAAARFGPSPAKLRREIIEIACEWMEWSIKEWKESVLRALCYRMSVYWYFHPHRDHGEACLHCDGYGDGAKLDNCNHMEF